MKRNELRVYDAFPNLVDVLVTAARETSRIPLGDMRAVCDRIEAAGMYRTVDGRTVPFDAEAVAALRSLIDAAAMFRDTAVLAVARGVQR